MENIQMSSIISALENTWAAIQQQHADTPQAIFTIYRQEIKSNARYMTRGYFAPGAFKSKDGKIHEVFISSLILKEGAASVLETLLHEAAHGVNNTRKIEDVSRQGKYHNRHFAAMASEMGLKVSKDKVLGYTTPGIEDTTQQQYAAQIDLLTQALKVYQDPKISQGKKSTRMLKATCDCGRVLRGSRKVFTQGPIICGLCKQPFILDDDEDMEDEED